MSIDALIAACYTRSCAPPPVGSGGSTSGGGGGGGGGGGSTAAMRNPLGAARAAAGASGVEHLIKQSAGHPAQRYIEKAHQYFRDAHRTGIAQNDSQALDHARGMKALRQAHAVAKASSPKGTLHVAIKTALDKKKALSPKALAASATINNHTKEKEPPMKNLIIDQAQRLGLPVPASLSASGFTKEEFMAAAEEFYNRNHSPKDGKFTSGGGGGGGPVGGPKKSGNYATKVIPGHTQNPKKSGNYTTKPTPAVASIKHRLSAKRIQQGARRADYLNSKVGTPASKKRTGYPVGGDGQPRHGIAQTIADNKARRASMGLKPAPHGLDRSGKPKGIAAKIVKHNELNPKKSGNYITKRNADQIAAAESRAKAKATTAKTLSKFSKKELANPDSKSAWKKVSKDNVNHRADAPLRKAWNAKHVWTAKKQADFLKSR